MRIVWLGWTGPCMNEISAGIAQYDPNALYYIIGKGVIPELDDYGMFGTRKNERMYTTKEHLLRDLEDFDIIIHDSYIFSSHFSTAGRITSLIEDPGDPLLWDEWKDIKAKKILFDGESMAGHYNWYYNNLKLFDHTVTCNKDLPGFYTYYGIDPKVYKSSAKNDRIKVLFSGDGLGLNYREDICKILTPDNENLCLNGKVTLPTWITYLNNSKMYLATYSCASGCKTPMCLKQKDAKALLCGCLPITEEYDVADQFLVPGKERVTFSDFRDMRNKIKYYNEHEDERLAIVAAGQKKVMAELTNDRMWKMAFDNFGIGG